MCIALRLLWLTYFQNQRYLMQNPLLMRHARADLQEANSLIILGHAV